MEEIGLHNEKLFSLTNPQKRIWYLEKVYPNRSLNNIGGIIYIKGNLNYALFAKAIQLFIERTDEIRIRIVEKNKEARQFVYEYEEINIPIYDFSNGDHPKDKMIELAQNNFQQPFVLENECLFDFSLVKLTELESSLYIKLHHIIADGWSIQIMTNEIYKLYSQLVSSEVGMNKERNCSYFNLVEKETLYLTSKRFIRNKEFWNSKFQSLPEIIFLKSSEDLSGNRKKMLLDSKLTQLMRKFVEEQKCSLNTLFIFLFSIYLYKLKQQEDLIIGTPILNRSGRIEKDTFGMYSNTIPFRVKINVNQSAVQMLKDLNNEIISYYSHQSYPYERLIEEVELNTKGYHQLFQFCVNYYNTKLKTSMGDCDFENIELYSGNQIYSIQLIIKDWSDSDQLELYYDYKVGDYTEEQIEEWHYGLLRIFEQINNLNEIKIDELQILNQYEHNYFIYDFNNTESYYPQSKNIIQLIEEQVKLTPNNIALEFEKESISYEALSQEVDKFIIVLQREGIEAGDKVALCVEHSLEMVVAILSIFKLGGVYVPIDPNYPKERIDYILNDSESKILLVNEKIDEIIDSKLKKINIHNKELFLGTYESIPSFKSAPDDVAYIIYTSGTTGKPKGTMIHHQGLVNYIYWSKKQYVSHSNEAFALYTSIAFDLTITSIFTPLICGCKIIIYRDQKEEFILNKILKDNKVTVIKLTPSHLSLIKNLDLTYSSVKRLIVGGENLKTQIAKEVYECFGSNIDIFNEYGPTETVVGCMIHKYDALNDNDYSVPIGHPISNMKIYILDVNLKPLPIGAPGELFIGGDGVGIGYWNQSELTQKHFVQDPFCRGKRMYKTGDLAKFNNKKQIEYIGRIDKQVKINGYRIELEEIENQLLMHSAVSEAIVIDRTLDYEYKDIVAYIVAKQEVTNVEMKRFLVKKLPVYMIPAYFVKVDHIPLTPNGKVDQLALPNPNDDKTDEVYFKVINDKEGEIIKIIEEVLRIDQINLHNNFYYLGGDSIKAIQIVSKIQDLGLSIEVNDIMTYPIIIELLEFIDLKETKKDLKKNREGYIAHTPISKWFFNQKFQNPHYWNQTLLLKLNQKVLAIDLKNILTYLFNHHDALRINVDPKKQLLYIQPLTNLSFDLYEFDLSDRSEADALLEIDILSEKINRGMQFGKGSLFGAAYIRMRNGENRLLLTAHHLLVDGISWRILLDDLTKLILCVMNQESLQLLNKTHSIGDWADGINKYSKEIPDDVVRYWKKEVSNTNQQFPMDHDLGKDTVAMSRTIAKELEQELSEDLLTIANKRYRTRSHELILSALFLTLQQYMNESTIMIELEGHGREPIVDDVDITRTIGWFTSLFPVVIRLGTTSLDEKIKTIKDQLRAIPHNGIDFGMMNDLSPSPKFYKSSGVRFNFLGEIDTGIQKDIIEIMEQGTSLRLESDEHNHLTSLLDIVSYVKDGKLRFSITYSKNKFKDTTVELFLDQWIDEIKKIVHHCCFSDKTEFTTSDFETITLQLDDLDKLFK